MALLVAVQLAHPGAVRAAQPWDDPSLSPDRRADLMAAQMLLPEKVGLVTGLAPCANGADGFVPGIPRLGLPSLTFTGAGAGIAGVCPNRANGGKATLLPAPIAMAASWDPATAYADGALIGQEGRDFGFNVSIGGDVNLARDPRNGRTFEGEGEDPLLAGSLVGAQLRGTQDQHMVATIKHFAMNDEEANRLTASSEVDERTMQELELRAFHLGLERSGAGAVMCSYNKINGVPACENDRLLNGVLKGEWGFPGWVMTDWWACAPPAVFAPADQCTTAGAALAGLDQQQPNASYYGPALLAAVATGQVPMARLDGMVHRILRSMFAAGLVDDPPAARAVDPVRGAEVAREVEERSAVLLKNRGGELPLPARNETIAVIGAPADEAPPAPSSPLEPGSPDGSSAYVNPLAPDTPLQGIADEAPAVKVRYADGSDLAAARSLARSSDRVVVFATSTQGEGHDMASLALDDEGDRLIAAVAAANPHTTVVLMTPTATTMPWLGEVPAVLEAWYPGERGGHAIAWLLFGKANPSGRLPITFPADEADLPTAGSAISWPGTASEIDYTEKLLSGYRWYDAKGIRPLFPFGFGLSYGGRFSFGKLAVDGERVVRFRVANRGSRRAAVVPQVYVGFPAAAGEPPKRLAGWRKIWLRPGESRAVAIPIDDEALSYWDEGERRFAIAPGLYPVCVGTSASRSWLAGAVAVDRPGGTFAGTPPAGCSRRQRAQRREAAAAQRREAAAAKREQPAKASAAPSTPPLSSGDGLEVVSQSSLSPRLLAATVRTAALPEPVNVRILLPPDYGAEPQRRYPVLYLLHGTSGGAADWTTQGEAAEATAGLPLIVVMPDIALGGDGGGWCTNWPNGAYSWETFHVDQLVPWVDANLRTAAGRESRAIAGLSQGGFCAMSYAARHPDLFATAFSYSGAPDIAWGAEAIAASTTVINATEVGLDRVPPNSMFGDRATNEVNWAAHDPATLAPNLSDTRIFLFTGNGAPGPLDGLVPNAGAMTIEALAHDDTVFFHRRLEELGIPSSFDDYGPGTHSWPYWVRDLRQSIGPLMASFADPPAPPPAVHYTSAEGSYGVYGWGVTMHRTAREFSSLENARRGGFELSGSGSATVVTPPVYRPRRAYRAKLYGSFGSRTVVLRPRGRRLRIEVPLGPANPYQQYTAAAAVAGTKSYRTSVSIEPLAKRRRR